MDLNSFSVFTSDGTVSITGQGGNASDSGSDVGVLLGGTDTAGSFVGSNTGPIFVSGTGGSSTGTPQFGAGVLAYNTTFNAPTGQITGIGANSAASNNYGVQFAGNVSATPGVTFSGTGQGGAADVEEDNSLASGPNP